MRGRPKTPESERQCAVPDCPERRIYRLYCNTHYRRMIRTGTVRPDDPIATKWSGRPLAERFAARVDKSGECWVWTGKAHLNPRQSGPGYGRIVYEGRNVPATHAAWFLEYGEWPADGLLVLHTCDNPPCVRPSHLWLGTQMDNMEDMRIKGRAPYGR